MGRGARRLPGEFALIAEYFAPLARDPSALGLVDDAALFTPSPGCALVLTKDIMIGGVHFPVDERADRVARKLLRVNLSDLAAMGARPRGYLLGIAIDGDIGEAWLAAFRDGLAQDQEEFGLNLLGGDTVSTPGPLALSVTALGEVAEGKALRRSGAQPGDRVFVSGAVGDAYIGLQLAKDALEAAVSDADAAYFLDRFRLPAPRLALGEGLRDIATAVIDVSDGLIADLGHICEASGVGAAIGETAAGIESMFSEAGRRLLETAPGYRKSMMTGGDDYELLFTAPESRREAIAALSDRLEIPLCEIGEIRAGDAPRVNYPGAGDDDNGPRGYTHF